MAIGNDILTNRLDKKINYGVARTAKDSVLAPTAEVLSSPIFNPADNLMMDSDLLYGTTLLPNISVNDDNRVCYINNNTLASDGSTGSTNSGDVAGILELFPFPASSEDGVIKSFIACSDRSSTSQAIATRLRDWIPFAVFGPTYLVKIAIAENGHHLENVNPSTLTDYQEIFPGTDGFEWYFDVDAGILTFPNSIPTLYQNDLSNKSIYLIRGARYVGRKGVKSIRFGDLAGINFGSAGVANEGDILKYSNGEWKNLPVDEGLGFAITNDGVDYMLTLNNDGSGTGHSNFTFDGETLSLTGKAGFSSSSGSAGYIFFEEQASSPSTPTDQTAIFAKAAAAGGTGLYFKKNSDEDELVSRKKAITYGLIF